MWFCSSEKINILCITDVISFLSDSNCITTFAGKRKAFKKNWYFLKRLQISFEWLIMVYPSLSGAPRPASLPSIRADDSSSRLGSSICQIWKPLLQTFTLTLSLKCISLRDDQTSSKNCCVRRRMCFSSVSSRKFFFRASWLVLISFSSFSSFSNVACHPRDLFFTI